MQLGSRYEISQTDELHLAAPLNADYFRAYQFRRTATKATIVRMLQPSIPVASPMGIAERTIAATVAWLTISEAAARFPLSSRQIRHLVKTGVVKGQRVGPLWTLDEGSLARYVKSERKPGPRPQRTR